MNEPHDIIPDDLAYLLTTGVPYRRRDSACEVFVIEPDHINVGRGGWLPKRRGPLGG